MKRRFMRVGFTLIELLVVMTLMAILAALAIRFLPSASAQAREARGGMTLQGWLNIAKQRALRDQAPRGLRLFIAPTGVPVGSSTVPGIVECQYLETPEDFTGNASIQNGLPLPPPLLPAGYFTAQNCINFTFPSGQDLFNGDVPTYATLGTPITPATPSTVYKYWSVQPGDMIEFLGVGLVSQITDVGVPNAVGAATSCIRIQPPLPVPLSKQTSNFRIMRRPRPVGDEMLKMPPGTMIELPVTGMSAGLPSGTSFFDIVFAPSGAVLSVGADGFMIPATGVSGKIHLFVRAPDTNDGVNGTDQFYGDPTLISTYVHTGFVGAYPPARPPSNAYILVP